MTRELRTLPYPGALVEITQQTIQRRFLLRPSARANELIVGCLARAQKSTAATVHAVAVLSDHFHLLASFDDVEQMARFMGQFKGNVSKELGRLHRWSGPMFARRYHSAVVSNEPASQIGRLRYVLSQGAKEGLVASPREWPGVHSAAASCRGEPLRGVWVDRTDLWARRGRREDVGEDDVSTSETVELSPLPCWAHCSAKAARRNIRGLVRDIERETRLAHQRAGTKPLGPRHILSCDTHQVAKSEGTPTLRAIRFHAATLEVRRRLIDGYRELVASYREAARRLRMGDRTVQFPENCFPPRLPFIEPGLVFR